MIVNGEWPFFLLWPSKVESACDWESFPTPFRPLVCDRAVVPVSRTTQPHRKFLNAGRHAHIRPTLASTALQMNAGAASHVVSELLVLWTRACIRSALARQQKNPSEKTPIRANL